MITGIHHHAQEIKRQLQIRKLQVSESRVSAHAHWWLLLGHGSLDTVVLFCTHLSLNNILHGYICVRACVCWGVGGWVLHTPWCSCGDRGQLGEPGSQLLPRGAWGTESRVSGMAASDCLLNHVTGLWFFPCCLRQGHINPGRFQTWYVTKEDIVLLVLVSLLPRCWDDRHACSPGLSQAGLQYNQHHHSEPVWIPI